MNSKQTERLYRGIKGAAIVVMCAALWFAVSSLGGAAFAQSPTPTEVAQVTPTTIPTPAGSPMATGTPDAVATPTETATPDPLSTQTSEPDVSNTPEPTATETPQPTATHTPEPTATATHTPQPTATNTLVPTATSTRTATPVPGPTTSWLTYVNYYRTMAKLPAVTENMGWSAGAWKHARYIAKNDVLQHTEENSNQWYSREGLLAAQASDIVASNDINAGFVYAVDAWMQAPFHAVGVLDPALQRVGFGIYNEAGGTMQMGAALDVARGTGAISSAVSFPVAWPGEGATVPQRLFWGENPNPLTSCPGYSAPAGLPIILQIGAGELTPKVTAHSFKEGTRSLEHCIFDETNYRNPDAAAQSVGRAVLNARDAIVIIPRSPLRAGATYTVSVTANGATTTWAFSVASTGAKSLNEGAEFENADEAVRLTD